MISEALLIMIQSCAPMVHPSTMASVITVESSGNPFAIGVVGGKLARQPKFLEEALVTARQLEKDGWNYSVGIAQVNYHNLHRFGLTIDTAFDPCTNIYVGGQILHACYSASVSKAPSNNDSNFHLTRALSCYYSGRLESKAGSRYATTVFHTHEKGVK